MASDLGWFEAFATVVLDDGGIAEAWVGRDDKLYVRHPSGTPVSYGSAWDLAAIPLTDGGWILTWKADNYPTPDFKAVRFDSQSATVVPVTSVTSMDTAEVTAVMGGTPDPDPLDNRGDFDGGGYVVTMLQRDPGTGLLTLVAQRYDAEGEVTGDPIPVATYYYDQQNTGSIYALVNITPDEGFAVSHAYMDTYNYTTFGPFTTEYAATDGYNWYVDGDLLLVGDAVEDTVLTADTSGLSDDNGLGTLSYQWLRDGDPISGASGASYSPTQEDVGAKISVVVTYVDQAGHAERIVSDETGFIANANDAPTGTPDIVGTLQEGETLTVDLSALADEDGLGIPGFQWLRDGARIPHATDPEYVLREQDVGAEITVRIYYFDQFGTRETVYSAAAGPVANLNDPPSGQLAIQGSPQPEAILTADTSGLSDPDGLGDFVYQWYRDGAEIPGATGRTHMVSAADAGLTFYVTASYVDGGGTTETVVSLPTGPVVTTDDSVSGSNGADQLDGWAGDDILGGRGGPDTLTGGSGNDSIQGGAGGDWISGGSGDDDMNGGIGFDTIDGGAGHDTLVGRDGYDLLAGGSGDDLLEGNNGRDDLHGEDGDDLLYGGLGPDSLYGGAGEDSLFGGEGADLMLGGAGNDLLDGQAGADTLRGNDGDDLIYGRANHDVLYGQAGADTLHGGNGFDELAGGDGDDSLEGNAGSDTLDGGQGNDWMRGGIGADTFRFAQGADWIHDFQAGIDTLWIDPALLGVADPEPDDLAAFAGTSAEGDLVLDFGDGDLLTLHGIGAVDLILSDVLFG